MRACSSRSVSALDQDCAVASYQARINTHINAKGILELSSCGAQIKAGYMAAHLKADDVLALCVAARDFDGVVNRLAAAVGEEEASQAGRRNGQQPVDQAHLQCRECPRSRCADRHVSIHC